MRYVRYLYSVRFLVCSIFCFVCCSTLLFMYFFNCFNHAYLGREFDLSGSRDVIGHVTICFLSVFPRYSMAMVDMTLNDL